MKGFQYRPSDLYDRLYFPWITWTSDTTGIIHLIHTYWVLEPTKRLHDHYGCQHH
ncbi:hypothetical protein LX36DRAFT_661504 [Colletotrichum falcatum]|nr:hypothetical protein LX36DRAFT_661504 [Colletotrichum falcatum]